MTDTAEAARYRRARSAQNELAIEQAIAGVQDETPEYEAANHETITAAAALRWWTVAIIDAQEARRGDYHDRMEAALALHQVHLSPGEWWAFVSETGPRFGMSPAAWKASRREARR